jgi:uncharacterized repeat protein (TIGR03806 family)
MTGVKMPISCALVVTALAGCSSGLPAGLDRRPVNTTCLAPSVRASTERVYPALGFSSPILWLQAPGEPNRAFVAEQGGLIKTFPHDDGATATTTFIDLTGTVRHEGEMGLLGMAFHPDWAQNRKAILSYVDDGGSTGFRTVISRFTSLDGGQTLAPGSEEVLLTIEHPYGNHKGGNVAFGPDGRLYAGIGDGGSGGDPHNHAQNPNSLLGKMLRIDVDATPDPGLAYAIPSDNPFAGGGGRGEIYALGFRNPWRFSFDRGGVDLWLGDVGQGDWEEVDQVVLGGNYGWRIKEGSHCYLPPNGCGGTGLIDPVAEYSHAEGISITGGFVYRGTRNANLVGRYVYGDFGSGRIWALEGGVPRLLQDTSLLISSFGQGEDGEIYVVHYNGAIHRLVEPEDDAPHEVGELLSATGCFDPADPKRPAEGLIPYEVNAQLWSDGAAKERYLAIPNGTRITVGADGDWEFPEGSVLAKTFLVEGRRIETRLFMHHAGGWAGYSYERNDAETDATLLTAEKTKPVGDGLWYFPSRADCMQCHTSAAGFTLGPETAQMNREIRYPTGRSANQIPTLARIGLLANLPNKPLHALPRYADPTGNRPARERARAYLQANCAICHRPGGTTQAFMDLRYATPLAKMNICNVAPTAGDLGVTGAALLTPGKPAASILSYRVGRRDGFQMPPLATLVVDWTGTDAVDDWIAGLTGCSE